MKLLVLLAVLSGALAADEICCDVVGCFNDAYPFANMPLPECPEEIQVSMQVFTRNNPQDGQVVTPTSIPFAFDANLETMFLTHGFLGGHNNNWLHDMKDHLLIAGNYNVIISGWGGGSQTILYPQAAANTQVVGAWMAVVADNLVARGRASYEDFTCIGHSLGGHICGQQGGRVQGNFYRITGLDPAGPWFENNHWSNGLNPYRATLVDVLHTNGEPNIEMNLGTMRPLGHVDFYPNGGGRQPGCVLDPLRKKRDVDPMPACSHMRVLDLYLHSIRTPCFKVHRAHCTNPWQTPESCGIYHPQPIQSMGYDSNQYEAQGVFWLETTPSHPWCM